MCQRCRVPNFLVYPRLAFVLMLSPFAAILIFWTSFYPVWVEIPEMVEFTRMGLIIVCVLFVIGFVFTMMTRRAAERLRDLRYKQSSQGDARL